MMLDINFPGKRKQPDSAFLPNPRPRPNNILGNLVKLQPVLGSPWPTVVLEVGGSESVSMLTEHRNKYLGYTTQVNVFVGVSYNRNSTRDRDSWWICLAYRDTHAPQPPAGTDVEYPRCIIAGELERNPANRLPLLSQPIPPHLSTWSIATYLLFHPEPVPVMNPPFPATFEIDVEEFRNGILDTRPQCMSYFYF